MKINNKIKQYLKFLAIGSLIFISTVLILSSIVVYFYGDEVAELIVKELNKKIKTELYIKDVKFSVLKKFPNASLELENVKIKATNDFTKKQFDKSINEYFLVAEKVYLSFNIVDVFNEKYEIKRLDVENAQINILNDSKNKDNYHFWIQDSLDEQSNFKLILQNVQFKNSKLNYFDYFNQITTTCLLKNCNLEGKFAQTGFDLEAENSILIHHLEYQKVTYIKNKELWAEIVILENNGSYKLKDVDFQFNGLDFYFNGLYNSTSDEISFRLKGNDLDYSVFREIIPEIYVNYLPKSNENGEIELDLSYQSGTKSYLNIEKLNLELGKSSLSLKAYLQNLDNPELELQLTTELDLSELNLTNYFEIDTLLSASGIISGSVDYKGKMNSNFRFGYTDGSFLKSNLEVEDLIIRYREKEFLAEGKILVDGNLLELNEIELEYLSNSLTFSGKSNNFFDFLANKNEFLNLDGNLECEALNINELVFIDTTQQASNLADTLSSPKGAMPFWQKIKYNLNCKIEAFEYEKFTAENITANLIGTANFLTVKQLKMNTMDGTIKGNYELIVTDEFMNVKSTNSVLDNLDVKKTFLAFDNFWQSTLLHENIEGILHAENSFSIYFDHQLNMLYDKNLIHTKVKLKNGALINFQPLEALSSFVKMNELKKIQFTELENEFFMKNARLTVPEMSLNSQIVNMNVSGEYNINGEFLFSLKIGLYSLLSNKFSKRRDIIKDKKAKMGVYLLFSGNQESYDISYDKEKIRNILKENTSYTKEEVSLLLKNEKFEKDTTIVF